MRVFSLHLRKLFPLLPEINLKSFSSPTWVSLLTCRWPPPIRALDLQACWKPRTLTILSHSHSLAHCLEVGACVSAWSIDDDYVFQHSVTSQAKWFLCLTSKLSQLRQCLTVLASLCFVPVCVFDFLDTLPVMQSRQKFCFNCWFEPLEKKEYRKLHSTKKICRS